jgi:hypothetical protein
MESLRKVLQHYSGSPVKLGAKKAGPTTAKTDRESLQRELTGLSRKNEKYFVVGIAMALVLFAALVVVAFVQLGRPESYKAVPPIFGSSAALIVWRTFQTWREKSYTDCVLALVPNVDEETLKTIVGVLVKKI